MKIAIVNDTHFGARQESVHFNNYFFRFWDNVFFPYIDEHKIDHITHLGDLVDRRKFINYIIAHSMRSKFFQPIKDRGISMDCLIGNHDVPYRNTNIPNAQMELLGEFSNVRIIADPCVCSYDGLPVALLPWINSGNYEQSINTIMTSTASVLFGHLEISGYQMDKGHICDTGLSRHLFDRYAATISGHFHTKTTDGSIFYLGTQYELTWSDWDDSKGFHIFDTDTLEITMVRNPYKMFHKIWYDDTEQNLTHWKNFDMSAFKDCYVKMVVTNKTNPFLFERVMDMLYKTGPIDIVIVEDFSTGLTLKPEEVEVNQAEDTPTIINKHIDAMKLTDVDPEKVKKVARDLYTEALGMDDD
jgi:DNA repair exonuclease SbcCD nuclease subunit